MTYSLSDLLDIIAGEETKHLYNTKQNRWTDCPDLTAKWSDDVEQKMATFLNGIVDKCVHLLGLPGKATVRRWTADHSTIPLSGHLAKRKPDLILLDDLKVADWRCVRSIVEMKASSSEAMNAELFQQIAGEFCCHCYWGYYQLLTHAWQVKRPSSMLRRTIASLSFP